ncbi:hypothetical protein NIIDNTM18_42210 [Mycolicibacterium litorale]|uniref:Uncharacterized protein n=1 Tax=Mycolicibacterium litorale TaxID=758802 RepID=A0A6S6P500_9MYCO|nr:hypothetical protein [Mycolicibacterium litorale]BCI54943.1 hypothetical protein NIIDNTM18_42210 [Mycolicibacterium litorale]
MHARWTIQHASYQPAGEDPDGYTVPESFADPVERLVYLIQPQRSEVPVGNDDLSLRVINSLVIGVPDVTLYKPGDRIALPGGDINDDESAYRVSEDVQNMSFGPWDFKPSADATAFGAIVVERVSG